MLPALGGQRCTGTNWQADEALGKVRAASIAAPTLTDSRADVLYLLLANSAFN